MSGPEPITPSPDIDKMPNFAAVKSAVAAMPSVVKWLERLERWCGESIDEREADSTRNAELSGQLETLAREMEKQRDAEDLVSRIEQRLEDTQRGLFTWDETADWLQRENR